MSESTDRTKLLQDSTESDNEDIGKLLQAETEPLVPNKDDPATMTLGPVSSGKQEEQNSQLDKQTQPPRYEPGAGSSADAIPQHGGGWIVYDATHPQPAPPRPTATHTSIQKQTTVVQVQPYTVSRARPAPPPTYFGVALFATLCCFWPLGVAAILKSNEVKKYHGAGNYELAREASDKAYSYSKMSIMIGIILNIVSGVSFGVFAYFRVTAFNSTT